MIKNTLPEKHNKQTDLQYWEVCHLTSYVLIHQRVSSQGQLQYQLESMIHCTNAKVDKLNTRILCTSDISLRLVTGLQIFPQWPVLSLCSFYLVILLEISTLITVRLFYSLCSLTFMCLRNSFLHVYLRNQIYQDVISLQFVKVRKEKKNYATILVNELCIYPHIFSDGTHDQPQDSDESSLQPATSDGAGRGDRGGVDMKRNMSASPFKPRCQT